jgi:hypothetical protein
MGLQSQYDLDVAEDELAGKLEREVRPYQGFYKVSSAV